MNTILAFCVVAFCTIQSISCHCEDDLVIEIEQGKVKGVLEESKICSKYYAYKGIPYGKPPIGSLRFKAPEKAESWNATRDCSEYGPVCPHYDPITNMFKNTSEDNCLNLNIYTPRVPKECNSLPVIIYIGSLAYLSMFSMDMYGPDYFMANDVIVVTFSYRLGPLGFLSLGTEDVPGNQGMKDQCLAFKWVQENIPKFGGNPDSVTLIGHSAGSAAVYNHLVSPMSAGLFNRAILLSGVTSDSILPYKVKEKSYLLAEKLGFNTTNEDELLTSFQNVEYEKLVYEKCELMASEEQTNVLFKKMAQFAPVIESDHGQERFLTEPPVNTWLNGNMNKAEVLIAYANKEAMLFVKQYEESLIKKYARYIELFVPNKIIYTTTPEVRLDTGKRIKNNFYGNKTVCVENMNEFIEAASFVSHVYNILKFAKTCCQYVDTYLMKFSCKSKRNYYGNEGDKYGVSGAAHGDMIFYMWDPKPLNWTEEEDSPERKMTKQFVNTLLAFATTGNPNYSDETSSCSTSDDAWPKYTLESQKYAEFTDTITVKEDPESDQMEFMDGIYEIAYLSQCKTVETYPMFPFWQ